MFQFKNLSMQQIASQVAIGVLCLSTSCFSNSAGIALLVQKIDEQVVRLKVTAKVNGAELSPEEFGDIQGRKEVVLGFQLPNAYLGAPIVFDIEGLDSRGCVYQVATKGTSTDASRRYDLNVDLTLYTVKKSNGISSYNAAHADTYERSQEPESRYRLRACEHAGASSGWGESRRTTR